MENISILTLKNGNYFHIFAPTKGTNKTMSKSNKKSSVKWNTSALNAIAKKYAFTPRYIKQCITGERTPIFSDRIKAEYNTLKGELETILNNDKL